MATFSDDFNRADGALGANWVVTSGAGYDILSNQKRPTTTFTGASKWATDPDAGGNIFSQVRYTASPSGISVFCGPALYLPATLGTSAANSADFYVFIVSGIDRTNYTIRRKDNAVGTLTIIATATLSAFVLGETMRLETQGNDLVAFVNGSEVLRATNGITGTPLSHSNRAVGQYSTGDPDIRMDDFAGGNVSTTTTTIVRPSSTVAAGGWTTGAASLHAALSDQSNSTIITGTGA